ncbi:MAG: DUF3048 domain-containing protein [Pleurocapsa minor GSE-CHR-MK-17-07R]|nr:DUF3048 domain-containing protein [Pleurocapsa minor GSE-CHR-MK 17-07R]
MPAKRLLVLVLSAALMTLGAGFAAGQEAPFTFPLGYPPNFAPNVNPLTGLPVADITALARRPLIVKVSNAPDVVRPQRGIGAADVVFEHIAEGGLTRYSAIYLGEQPASVGSVRSARLIDDTLTPMFGALLAYSGASPGTENVLQSGAYRPQLYSGFYLGGPFFARDFSIAAPNNLFIDPAAIWSDAAQDGNNTLDDLRGWVFDFSVPPYFVSAAMQADVRYVDARATWTYDPSLGLYRRADSGVPLVDPLTNIPVVASNVVIVYDKHLPTTIEEGVFNGVPYYGIDINLSGEGSAVVLRDGLSVEAIWRRGAEDALISFWTLDGRPIAFKPGKTWFQVLPPPPDWRPGSESVTISAVVN